MMTDSCDRLDRHLIAILLVFYFALARVRDSRTGTLVLGADLVPERMRGRFFSFQRLVNEVGGAISPTAFACYRRSAMRSLLAGSVYAASPLR
jgi:hypothetical protein